MVVDHLYQGIFLYVNTLVSVLQHGGSNSRTLGVQNDLINTGFRSTTIIQIPSTFPRIHVHTDENIISLKD
jgi:hypothetical protein